MTDNRSTSSYMSGEEQDERRKQIREIMSDATLSQLEKSRAVQSLMDGRRRNSAGTRSVCSNEEGVSTDYVSTMARAAAVAADYYSDEEGDCTMGMHDSNTNFQTDGMQLVDGTPANDIYGYDDRDNDQRSVASSVTHTSHHDSNNFVMPPGQYKQIHGRSKSLQDFNNDRAQATFLMMNATTSSNQNSIFSDNPAQISRLMEKSRPECQHYERNCTIVSPCCGLAFGCRICHDECPVLPPPLSMRNRNDNQWGAANVNNNNNSNASKLDRRYSMPLEFEDEDENYHAIDRFAIREVICRHCYTRQSSKTNECSSCGVVFAKYHCNICNLWMGDQDNPYHCMACGFCRVGGRENFKHCDDCGMCIDGQLFDDHNCKAGKYMSNCPVCQEDLFCSRKASHEMPCGHAIHWQCFKELTSFDTRCPVCKKTAETREEMAATWSALAMGIALQPVPPDMARVVHIVCNDCEERDTNRRWHFLGVRCMHCMSFNTVVEETPLHGREAAEYLDALEAGQDVPNTTSATSGTGVTSTDDSNMMDEDVPSAQETASGSTYMDT